MMILPTSARVDVKTNCVTVISPFAWLYAWRHEFYLPPTSELILSAEGLFVGTNGIIDRPNRRYQVPWRFYSRCNCDAIVFKFGVLRWSSQAQLFHGDYHSI